MPKTIVNNIAVVTEDRIIENGSLVFENSIIIEVNEKPISSGNADVIDGSGLTAVPGYIDTHCHGGAGFDTNDATVESVEGLAAFHLRHGVTVLYPTLAADNFDNLVKCFEAIREAGRRNIPGKTEIPGTHLEGPFLNLKYKGSQPEEYFIRFEDRHMDIIETYRDVIKRITLAPEVSGNMQRIESLRRLGIVVSGGHSDASYDKVSEAVDRGMTAITHLYNAMSSVCKEGTLRVCGMTEATHTLDALYAEIIADGFHVPVPLIQMAYRCKGPDKLLICSDANIASGCKEGGTYRIYGHPFTVENGMALNEERTSLAGSVTPMDVMVRNLVTRAGISLIDAAKISSRTPARMMGIDQRKGSLTSGKEADVNLLDAEYRVVKTFARGKAVD